MITWTKLEGAYAVNTVSAYERDMRKFASWCEGRGYSALPAEPVAVLEFVEACGRDCLARTVRRHLIAVGMLHRLNGFSDPTAGEDVSLALRRLARSRRTPPRQARGLSYAELGRILSAMPSTLVGQRDAAMLALGYEILGRRAEIVALRDTDLEFCENGTLRVTISRSKSDQTGRGRFAFTSRHTAELVFNWIVERGSNFPFLFCPIYRGQPIGRGLHPVTIVRAMQAGAERLACLSTLSCRATHCAWAPLRSSYSAGLTRSRLRGPGGGAGQSRPCRATSRLLSIACGSEAAPILWPGQIGSRG